MRERPIIFSAPMVRALLEGRKTQTRRILKPGKFVLPSSDEGWAYNGFALVLAHDGGTSFYPLPHCPYGVPGDRLYVKEAWADNVVERPGPWGGDPVDVKVGHLYRADREQTGIHWVPSIFMPREASRIDLEITEVRVQRLQEITTADAMAEGIPQMAGEAHAAGLFDMTKEPGHEWDNRTSIENYARLWDQINGVGSWDVNPWVWALTFRRVRP